VISKAVNGWLCSQKEEVENEKMGEHHLAIDDGGFSLVRVHGRISRGKEEVPGLRRHLPGYAARGREF
jgi:hypothetical protein